MDAQIGRQRDEGVEDLHCQLHSMELTVAALPSLCLFVLRGASSTSDGSDGDFTEASNCAASG